MDSPEASCEPNATVVVWWRNQIIGHDGKPLDVTPTPALHEVHYDLGSTEMSLAETVGELCRVLQSGTSQQAWIARSWLRSFQSSPAALEARLPKLASAQNQPTKPDSEALLDDLEDEDALENRLGQWLDPETAQKAAAVAHRLAEELEGLGSDSKLVAFAALLKQLQAPDSSSRRFCVLTDYVATLFYVATEIETFGVRCRLLHGSMTDEDRQSSVDAFVGTGGILTATSGAISGGIVLPQVTDLVFYDVPGSKTRLQRVLASFDRFGRRTQLNLYALLPSSDTFGVASESIQLLRQILGLMHAEERG